jgi:ferrous iron transport protein B
VPILILVLGGVFLLMFVLGNNLSAIMGDFWVNYPVQIIDPAIIRLLGDNTLSWSLLWGFDAGVGAALTIGIPFVLVFYIMLAFLEDTGYLNSVAFLTDSVMHKFGLHGRAMIPIVAGAGCNVPAIIGTRVLSTMRERVLAGTLIVLVPCSARTAVIFGAVAVYAGWQATLALYGIVLLLWIVVGLGLNKIIPGKPSGLVMEMFPFRRPHLKTIVKKTWYRFKAFVFMAVPILLVGSVILGALYKTGYLNYLSTPLSPVVEGWMGLPAVAGLTLVVAVLRKELALQLLVALAAMSYGLEAQNNLLLIMTKSQLFIFALVTAIYIPCAATIAALGREMGWKRAAIIMAFTVVLAILVGGIVNQAFKLFG